MYSDLIVSLETISCLLSLCGSTCVALTWAYPVENRRKHGRILLLWLSVSDFLSSIVYVIQSLAIHKTVAMCKALALLGIFFPIASFFWTDFIAFYLYLVVVRRTNKFEWSTLLRMFHLIAWCVAGLVVLFVGVYDRAGNASVGDDDAVYANSAGWCWISGSDKTSQFIWELIGGKVIEWLSCLVVLPYFYCVVRQKLRNWDSAIVLTTTTAPMQPSRPETFNSSSKRQFQSSSEVDTSAGISGVASKPSDVSSEDGDDVTGTVSRIVDNNQQTASVASASRNSQEEEESKSQNRRSSDVFHSSRGKSDDDDDDGDDVSGNESLDRSKYACEDLSEAEQRGSSFIDQNESGLKLKAVGAVGPNSKRSDLLPVMVKSVNISGDNNNGNKRGMSMVSRSAGKRRELFSQFYTKLLALPLVFLFIRTWGSLRVILSFANYHQKDTLQFFDVMQAFFDPSQGFFNAILFVFLSPEDRAHLLLSLAVVTAYIGRYFTPCIKLSECFASPADVDKEMKRIEKYQSNQRRTNTGDTGSNDTRASRATNGSSPAAGNVSPSSPAGRSSRSSSFGDISFEDESMFECDGANRISDFSFESRVDADNREFP